MLVFGDASWRIDPRAALAALGAHLEEVRAMPPGLARHSALVGALVDAGLIAQGVADAEVKPGELERRATVADATMKITCDLACDVLASWDSGFTVAPGSCAVAHVEGLPDAIDVRRPEGFSYYALYPEAYGLAARRAATDHPGPRTVIGIRSIGTTLAAVVAAATKSPVPVTVRPRGQPFARRLHAGSALLSEWSSATAIAVVDEGPCQSGRTFGAVLDALAGVNARVECFPGHGGSLGPAATAADRARWDRARRFTVDADALLVHDGTLARWISGVVGPLVGPLEDVSAGRWRSARPPYPRPPAVIAEGERKKLLARTATGTYIARFVGLGRHGDELVALARKLDAAGLVPPVAGACHGFLVERWMDDCAALDLATVSRPKLVASIGHYLAVRARLPAREEGGASLGQLVEMVRHNASLALGRTDIPMPAMAASLARRVRRVPTDGRMHLWEWLVTSRGDLVKCDAIDHHAAHDIVGCQDITWDIAGAEIELDLTPAEVREIAAVVASESGVAPDLDLLALMRPCYLAFQLGRYSLALDAAAPADVAVLRATTRRYARKLGGAPSGVRRRR